MKKNYYVVGLIMLTFFVISFLTNVFGPLMPDMIKGFSLSLTLGSLLPFAFFIAYGIMSIPTGMLLEKYKEKKIMLAAFVVSFIGSLMLAIFPNYLSAVLSLFFIGCGMAMLQVVINPLLRTAGGEENYAFYSVAAQLVFGLASFVSPLVYSQLVQRLQESNQSNGWITAISNLVPTELPWISLYLLFVIICVIMFIVIFFSTFPKVELSNEEKPGLLATHIELFKNRTVVLFFIAMICYVGTEQGIANWISQFLYTYHGQDPQKIGADTVAYFWGLMTAGGLLGLLLLKLMDSRVVLVLFTALAIACLAAGLFGTTSTALIAFPLVGFFASVIYPIIFSLALNSVEEHHGSFAGIIVTGIIGGAILPLIVGWIGDYFGLRTGMCILFISLAYILSIGFWAKPKVTNKTISLFKKNPPPFNK